MSRPEEVMTHYRMSFDDWLDQCRCESFFEDGRRWTAWVNERPEHRHSNRVNQEHAAEYVRDCIASKVLQDIDGPIP